MPKIDRILQILETRIARGDYALTLFPTEYGLAEEMGVGRMTARRAILRLIEKGLLFRASSGRLAVTAERSAKRPLLIGFVTATLSAAAVRWQTAVQHALQPFEGQLRVVTYFHWDDPTLLEATGNFDGIFLIPPAETLSLSLAERLRGSRARLVVLGADHSTLGLRSVEIVSPDSVNALLDHLAALGHRRITMLNTQPLVPTIQERITQWQYWLERYGYDGELINEPEPSYGAPMERAYQVASQRLSSQARLGSTAVLCTTLPAALGVMRAANEHSLTIGRDLSICTVNDEGLGPYLLPTLTSTRTPDPKAWLHDCATWMAGGEWSGPLLKRSDAVELFVGNSTGPSPDAASSSQQGIPSPTAMPSPELGSRHRPASPTTSS